MQVSMAEVHPNASVRNPKFVVDTRIEKGLIDNDAHRVLADDKEVNLTPKEYELLIFLAKTPNKVFDREQLLKEVWHYEFYGDLRTVDTHVKRLREKLNRVSNDAAHMIQTVWGVGYKFEVPTDNESTE